MPLVFAVSEIAGRRGLWLLEIDLGGELLRFSTQAIDLSTQDGRTLRYEAGLSDPGVAFDGAIEAVGVEIRSPRHVWTLLQAQGQSLERCPGVLRRWFPGQPFEASRVVLRGLTGRAICGFLDDPGQLSIELRRTVADLGDTLPESTHVVDASTWPVRPAYPQDSNVEGAFYPVVIGRPGFVDGGGQSTPGLLVEGLSHPSSRLLVAGHKVAASSVTVWNMSSSPPQFETRTVYEVADKLGKVISYTDFQSVTKPDFAATEGNKWWVGWHELGGLEWRGEELRGLGTVLEWAAVEHSAVEVDLGRIRSAAAALDAYKVDAVINAPVNVLDWIRGELGKVYPIREVTGDAGLYWAQVRYDYTRRDAVASLSTARGEIRSAGPLASREVDLYNEITVEYAPSMMSGRYRRRVIITGAARAQEIGPGIEERVLGSLRCQVSQARYGVRATTITCPTVDEPSTAARIASHMAALHATPRRWGIWVGGAELEALPLLGCIEITDPVKHLNGVLAVVERIEPRDGEVEIELTLLADPIRQDVSTSAG